MALTRTLLIEYKRIVNWTLAVLGCRVRVKGESK